MEGQTERHPAPESAHPHSLKATTDYLSEVEKRRKDAKKNAKKAAKMNFSRLD